MSITCKIKKKLGNFNLDIDFQGDKETIALIGGSGCGKSVTLRCIAGIVTPDEGIIIINGKVVFDSQNKINIPPQKRKVGYLFQDYALFPNMTVAKNIEVVIPKGTEYDLDEILARFHLLDQKNLHPGALSGGQKQRCALARIIVTNPEIILLDEPFSALDSYLRWQMEQEVVTVLQEANKPAIFVSHDRDEVYRISDKVVVVNDGKSDEILEKHMLYQHPKTYADALLTGCKNICPVELVGNILKANDFAIEIPYDMIQAQKSFHQDRIPASISYLGIRAKGIIPAFLVDADEKVVILSYEIESVVEGLFTYIIMIRPEHALRSMSWEMTKEAYRNLQGHPHQIAIPLQECLLLE